MVTKDFRQFPCAYISREHSACFKSESKYPGELQLFVAHKHCAVGMLVQDTACAGLFWIFSYPVEVHGSNLKCCFEYLENNSVSYQLNEPPGPSCTTIWSDMDMVLVDENGDMDQKTVVYLESQKLILHMEEKDKLVTYRKDCHLSGYAYEAECRDPCAAVDVTKSTQVTNSTVAPNGNKIICIIIISSSSIIITIIVIISIICCKLKYCSPPNVKCRAMWTAVPKNASTQV